MWPIGWQNVVPQQLRTVMQCIRDFFPLEIAQEYTVEAGRPDCTDEEKLAVMIEQVKKEIAVEKMKNMKIAGHLGCPAANTSRR